MDGDELELQLVDALQESELAALAGDYAELGLDALLDDGLLKDVPVLGTLQKLYNVSTNVRNRLFMKKLLQFLVNLADVPKEQRQKQISKLAVDVEERQRVGENLMLLLDKMNNMSKPAMMARALRAYLLEEINATSLRQLWHAIDVIDVAYIPELKNQRGQASLTLGGWVESCVRRLSLESAARPLGRQRVRPVRQKTTKES